jgi:hypothetical protein
MNPSITPSNVLQVVRTATEGCQEAINRFIMADNVEALSVLQNLGSTLIQLSGSLESMIDEDTSQRLHNITVGQPPDQRLFLASMYNDLRVVHTHMNMAGLDDEPLEAGVDIFSTTLECYGRVLRIIQTSHKPYVLT